MKLQWDILLNDDTKFPRLLFFGEFSDDRFRYGINSELQYCLYFFFGENTHPSPIQQIIRANISLEEKIEEGKPALVLTLLNEQVKNLFSDLISSIASQIHPIRTSSVKAEFIKLCNEWFELFEPVSGELTRKDLQGIFSELSFLKYLLTFSRFQFNDLLSAWKGPFGKGHDFELENTHFEIKGISEFKDFVQISSEYQLDFLSGQRLFLIIVEFGSEPAKMMALSELVNEITGILRSVPGTNMSRFWIPLGKTGLNYNSLHEYDHQLFAVKQTIFYDCTGTEFPAIRRSLVSDKINNITYTITTSGIRDYMVEDLTSFI